MIVKTMLDKHLAEVRRFCSNIRGYGPHSQMEAVRHLEFLLDIINELADEVNVRDRLRATGSQPAEKK